jgi:hypothetical protein
VDVGDSKQANSLIAGPLDAPLDAPDAVEAALADALTKAAAAGRFDVVAQLAREVRTTAPVCLMALVALAPFFADSRDIGAAIG